jgi:hypothetical protein
MTNIGLWCTLHMPLQIPAVAIAGNRHMTVVLYFKVDAKRSAHV